MTREELIAELKRLHAATEGWSGIGDRAADALTPAESHPAADQALLDYINDPEVSAAFHALHKWYD